MKKSLLTIVILFSGILATSLVTSCGAKKEQAAEDQKVEADTTKHQNDMAMAYSCPMHPEERGKEGDTCSKCGMKLEATKADSTKTHEHQH
jgi:Heavy metal binding domain